VALLRSSLSATASPGFSVRSLPSVAYNDKSYISGIRSECDRRYCPKKRKDASVYFEAKNNGMISSCGYVQDGCMDDCFNGINIASIGLL